MSGASLGLLVVSGGLFVAWAVAMFATLFQLRAATARRYGGSLLNIGNTFRGYRDFLRDAEWRPRRRLLAGLTLALFAAILARALLLAQATG